LGRNTAGKEWLGIIGFQKKQRPQKRS